MKATKVKHQITVIECYCKLDTFPRTLFSRVEVKDIFATLKIYD